MVFLILLVLYSYSYIISCVVLKRLLVDIWHVYQCPVCVCFNLFYFFVVFSSGEYVTGDISEEYLGQLHAMRNDTMLSMKSMRISSRWVLQVMNRFWTLHLLTFFLFFGSWVRMISYGSSAIWCVVFSCVICSVGGGCLEWAFSRTYLTYSIAPQPYHSQRRMSTNRPCFCVCARCGCGKRPSTSSSFLLLPYVHLGVWYDCEIGGLSLSVF